VQNRDIETKVTIVGLLHKFKGFQKVLRQVNGWLRVETLMSKPLEHMDNFCQVSQSVKAIIASIAQTDSSSIDILDAFETAFEIQRVVNNESVSGPIYDLALRVHIEDKMVAHREENLSSNHDPKIRAAREMLNLYSDEFRAALNDCALLDSAKLTEEF
jgi:hypothetical protein